MQESQVLAGFQFTSSEPVGTRTRDLRIKSRTIKAFADKGKPGWGNGLWKRPCNGQGSRAAKCAAICRRNRPAPIGNCPALAGPDGSDAGSSPEGGPVGRCCHAPLTVHLRRIAEPSTSRGSANFPSPEEGRRTVHPGSPARTVGFSSLALTSARSARAWLS